MRNLPPNLETQLSNLHERGEWQAIIDRVEGSPPSEPRLTDLKPRELEYYAVALNKSKRPDDTLAVVRSYMDTYGNSIADIKLSAVDPLDHSTRNTQASGEMFAAAGKAYRVASQGQEPDKMASILQKEGIKTDGLEPQDMSRKLLEISTKMYEAGFFLDRSYYSGINAAHNNFRLGNEARAQRFAWMAGSSMVEEHNTNKDYWHRATQLEAALLGGDTAALSKHVEHFLDSCRDSEKWMLESTISTLEGTYGQNFTAPGEELPNGMHLTFAILKELRGADDLSQLLNSDESHLKQLQIQLEEFKRPQSGLTTRQIGISELVFEKCLDREWRQNSGDLATLYEQASQVAESYYDALSKTATTYNADLVLAPPTIRSSDGTQIDNPLGLKGRERALQRIEDFAGDVSQLTDIVRASLVFKDIDNLYSFLNELGSDNNKSGLEVVSIKDRVLNPLDSGYRDVLLKINFGGHVCELQLHLEPLIEVKNGAGHDLYEQARKFWSRASDEGRALRPEEQMAVDSLNMEMRELYDDALAKAKEAA